MLNKSHLAKNAFNRELKIWFRQILICRIVLKDVSFGRLRSKREAIYKYCVVCLVIAHFFEGGGAGYQRLSGWFVTMTSAQNCPHDWENWGVKRYLGNKWPNSQHGFINVLPLPLLFWKTEHTSRAKGGGRLSWKGFLFNLHTLDSNNIRLS